MYVWLLMVKCMKLNVRIWRLNWMYDEICWFEIWKMEKWKKKKGSCGPCGGFKIINGIVNLA